ncbi:MAG: insulinase family protein [Proteobacteria bacterium]|nr:insulinase family protein [Pseudomonadota bacterium]
MTDNPVRKTVLGNGVRIISRKIPHVRSVSMGIWVNVGARDEQASENGLSHFIEHMLFKGTHTRSAYQIAKEFDAIGGHTNAFTSPEYTCYHARALDTHLESMAGLLCDILMNSEFSAHEIENERPVILSEVSMLEDSPEEYVHSLLEENYWEGHALGHSILGSPESINSFCSESVKAFFSKYYQPDRIIISVAGNVDHDRFLDLVAPAFESLVPQDSFPKRTQPVPNIHTRLYAKDLEQVHLCLGTKGLSLKDPSRFSCSLLNTLLGGNMSSRLFQEIREKRGLAYSIYSFSSLNIDTGLFGIYTGVAPEKVIQSLSLILEELDKFCCAIISESELSDAKEYTKGNILLSAESTESQMVRMAQNEIHFGRFIPVTETIEKIQAVTVDDILSLARHFFKSQRPSLTLLGPFDKKSELNDLLDGFYK